MPNLLKRGFRGLEAIARRYGYRVSWTPPAVLKSGRELSFDFEFAVAHLMLSRPEVFFVQIGANDGISNDPLHEFITRFRWEGVLIEPLPDAFRLLQQTYAGHPQLHLINAAVAEHDGMQKFYTIDADESTFGKAHQFSSFNREALLGQTDWVPDVAQRIVETEVPCLSFDSLVRAVGDRSVDILLIDAEGYDLAILRMIDFARMRPSIICYEHVQMTKSERDEAAALLIRNEYRVSAD
ncbi:MAG: FkbM family methyltransferase, partial [Acetobacteraceae bacterium]